MQPCCEVGERAPGAEREEMGFEECLPVAVLLLKPNTAEKTGFLLPVFRAGRRKKPKHQYKEKPRADLREKTGT